MSLAKKPIGLILSGAVFCLLFSATLHAFDYPEVLPLKGSITPGVIRQDNTPMPPSSQRGEFQKPGLWSNDMLVAGGSINGGFSADYDENGFIYAARCTTYVDSSDAAVRIYESTDGGASWFVLTGFVAEGGALKFSYPVVLTGSNPSKLYVFAMTSGQNGDIGMARFTQDGTWEGWHYVKADEDTITYFSACTDDGSHLMLAYQREANEHRIYTVVSTDSGTTWGNEDYIDDVGSHPDIAYGREGYVYLVWERNRGSDVEIWFYKHTNYGLSGVWQDLDSLTANFSDDTYPKVAAVHTTPKDTACVWVAYNHYPLLATKITDIDLNFAYSTNSGVDWVGEQVLANDVYAQEVAADLRVFRDSTFVWVDLCYLSYPLLSKNVAPDIFYTWSEVASPDSFYLPHVMINDNWPNWSEDSREVCQIVPGEIYPGIMYAGEMSIKNDESALTDGAWNLYYDDYYWSDVEEDHAVDQSSMQFSLSANYPNPFNPETRIDYSLSQTCRVKLEVFNVLGQKIRTLVDENQHVGNKEVVWDGKNERGEQVASGVYLYRLQAKDFVQTKKMVLMK